MEIPLVLSVLPSLYYFILPVVCYPKGGMQLENVGRRTMDTDKGGCIFEEIGQCGLSAAFKQTRDNRRRYRGVRSEDHAWPWLVSIQRKSERSHICGGTIIDRYWVLTAAHCLFEETETDDIKITAGTNDLTAEYDKAYGVQYREVKKIIFYPKYYGLGTAPDLALVQVHSQFCFNKYVRPICMSVQKFPEDTTCIAAGWRILDEANEQIKEIEVPLISSETCRLDEFYGKMVEPFEFCAGYAEYGFDSCQGDHGGALNCQVNGAYVIQGVVSRGQGCNHKRKPQIYTDVTSQTVIKWIEKTSKSVTHNNDTDVAE